MTALSDDEDSLDVGDRTYAKLSATLHKSGYKDGKSAGRESVFQRGFDQGYAEGFRNGWQLGIMQGKAMGLASITSVSQPASNLVAAALQDPLLKKPTRGQCHLCAHKDDINKSIPEIITLQQHHSHLVEQKLAAMYSGLDDILIKRV